MTACAGLLLQMNSLFQLFFPLAVLALGQHLDANSPPWSGIINGDPVLPTENWLPVVVTVNMNSSKVELIGSGVVITKDWVLTAGHLFNDFDDEDFANVLIGYGSLERSKQRLVSVRRVYSNHFNLTTRLGDIALLQVPGIGREALSSALKVAIKDTVSLGEAVNVTLVGWGSTKTRVPSADLRQTQMRYFAMDKCRRQLLADPLNKHVLISPSTNFCLINLHSTACYGDSGSPVFALVNSEIHLFGLVSWGNNTCSLGYPNVFTKLHHYRDLIHNQTGFDHWLP